MRKIRSDPRGPFDVEKGEFRDSRIQLEQQRHGLAYSASGAENGDFRTLLH